MGFQVDFFLFCNGVLPVEVCDPGNSTKILRKVIKFQRVSLKALKKIVTEDYLGECNFALVSASSQKLKYRRKR